MDWPAGLSHAQFGEGARAWAEQADGGERAGEELGLHEGAKNWKWAEHEFVAGLGYLHKTITVKSRHSMADDTGDGQSDDGADLLAGDVEDDDDVAVAPSATATDNWATAHLSICHSSTYQVPVLYFNVFDLSGSPLPLPAILKSSLFRRFDRTTYPFTTIPKAAPDATSPDAARSASTHASFGSTQDGTGSECAPPAPFVSQAEHPTLGTPAWFLHPCETQAIVAEVLSTRQRLTHDDLEAGRCWEREWLESWAMVVGSVVDLRG